MNPNQVVLRRSQERDFSKSFQDLLSEWEEAQHHHKGLKSIAHGWSSTYEDRHKLLYRGQSAPIHLVDHPTLADARKLNPLERPSAASSKVIVVAILSLRRGLNLSWRLLVLRS